MRARVATHAPISSDLIRSRLISRPISQDGTTAFALFINCFSSIDGVFQFGLCGGLLIITNFMLVLSYMPALLVLEERGGLAWGAP